MCVTQPQTYLVEGTSVLIAVIDADLSPVDARVAPDREVVWHVSATVVLKDDLTFEEGSLRNSRVDLLGLSDHDRLVFQVVKDGNLPDAMVLKAALNDMLLEVPVEAQHLLVKLDEGWLVQCLDVVPSKVVWELVV